MPNAPIVAVALIQKNGNFQVGIPLITHSIKQIKKDAMGPCIFCFRDCSEVRFSKEHIIPDSLGGRLVLNDFVCTECNSKFGFEFDHEILKNPQVVRALENLKLPHDRVQLIQSNYKIRGFSGEIEVIGRATKEGFEVPSQVLADGSVIHPEKDYKEPLLKKILRDQSLPEAGLTVGQIKEECRKLIDAYDKAKVGEKVEWPVLGITLVKRREAFKFTLEPKGSGVVSRLVAKIAYEFGFVVGTVTFL